MANLEVTFAGIKMRSPIGVAAMLSPTGHGRKPEVYADMLLRYVEAGSGYVYTAGTSAELDNPLQWQRSSGRKLKYSIPGIAKKMGVLTISDPYVFLHRMNNTLEVINRLKGKLPPDVPIIGDIVGPGGDAEGWAKAARTLEEAGVDMVELDPACPFPAGSVSPERRIMGHAAIPPDEEAEAELGGLGIWPLLADVPRALGEVTAAVVKAVKVPVGVKLSPESGFPRNVLIMKVLAKTGARFVASINGMISIAPPDIYNRGKPRHAFMDINPIGGALGPWLTPIVLKNVATGCLFVPELDHAAVGGIVHPTQMIEYMMLGAKHIGLASAIYLTEGTKAIRRFTNYLSRFLDEQGYEKVDDMIGIAQKYIKPITADTDWGDGVVVAAIDRSKCTDCGICIQGFCFGSLYEDKEVRGRPHVDKETCGGCCFCVVICPQEAITMVKREAPAGSRTEG